MSYVLIILLFITRVVYANDQFESEAKKLSNDLKSSLLKNLTEKISKDGVENAIEFCHLNVKPIAKNAADKRTANFEFGRTSHKIRNTDNKPKEWMLSYLKQFEGKTKFDASKDTIIHLDENKKRIYLEPLFMEAKCLFCHGENVDQKIINKIKQIYPDDKATGFKLGEFRGFIWVKEK
jgi:hypothetical protein